MQWIARHSRCKRCAGRRHLLQAGTECCAAVTAGVVESDIGSKALCDMERYGSPASAYYRIREAIRRRMAIPTKLVSAGYCIVLATEHTTRVLGEVGEQRQLSIEWQKADRSMRLIQH